MTRNKFDGNEASSAEFTPPTRVFICYARADQNTSQMIRQALENSGIEVLQDLDQFEPGDPWWTRAVELITASDRVIFIASQTSVHSIICGNELKEASEQGKVILPVRIDGVIWQDMPEVVAGIHGVYLPLDNSTGTSAALAELIESVSTNITWVRTNTQYFAEARRWNQGGRKSSDLLRGRRLVVGRDWIDKPSPANEAIHPLTMQFVAASTAGERRRRVIGVAAALSALTIVGVTGLVASFYNSDADLTATRLALAAGEIRAVEQRFAGWSAAPLADVLPRPASAESLATEILDYGLIANEERIGFSMKEGEELALDQVSVIPAGEHLHLMYKISSTAESFVSPETETTVAALLVVCSAVGTSCQMQRVDAEPGHELMLLSDGNRVFVADREFPTGDQVRSSITAQEVLVSHTITLAALDASELPLQEVADGYQVWRTELFVHAFDGPSVISNSPPLFLAEDIDQADEETFYLDEIVVGAACGLDMETCVMQVATEARANTFRFEQWTHQSDEDQADAEPKWRQLNAGFYTPSLTRNFLAMSRDGRLIAISAGDRVSLWLAEQVAAGFDSVWKSFDLGEPILGLSFNKVGTLLHLATADGITTIDLYPRLTVLRSEPAASVTSEDSFDFTQVELLHGKVIAKSDRCVLTIRTLKAGIDPISYQLPGCGESDTVSTTVVAGSDTGSVLALTVRGEDFVISRILALEVRLQGDAATIVSLATPDGAFLVASNEGDHRQDGTQSSGAIAGPTEFFRYTVDGSESLVERIAYSDEVRRAVEQANAEAPLIVAGKEGYIAALGAAGCGPEPEDKLPRGADLGLLVVRNGLLELQYLLSCAEGFPTLVDGNAQIGVVANGDGSTIFFGAYAFDGILEWAPNRSEVFLHRVDDSAVGNLPNTAVKRAALATDTSAANLITLPASGNRSIAFTDGVLNQSSSMLAFFYTRMGSLGSSYGVQLYDLAGGAIRDIEPASVETFDYVENVEFSPNGRLLIIVKNYSGYSVYDLNRGDQPLAVMDGTTEADFVANDMLRLELSGDSNGCWSLPEGSGSAVEAVLLRLRGIERRESCFDDAATAAANNSAE